MEMNYTYPDKQDALTCSLIETEYDGEYWGKSESAVLEIIKSEIGNACGNGVSLLDLGCGIGRMFEVFAAGCRKITACEPDFDRFSMAAQNGKKVSEEAGIPVDVINGDIHDLPAGEHYDVVLSSHVLPHIPCRMADELMDGMADRLVNGGVLVVMTTCKEGFCEGEEQDKADVFFRESWQNGARAAEQIDRAQFDATFGEDNVLPVRFFGVNTLREMGEKRGLACAVARGYHYKNRHSVSEDETDNKAGVLTGARDALYIFRKVGGNTGSEKR
jgi:2-polyprenyl-3-methyl-5-hydroxy-6-metoxy-1,4-benzoquinol methylase